MKVGKINETILNRAVFRQLNKRRDEVVGNLRAGLDCAFVQLNSDEYITITTDPIIGSREKLGCRAVFAATNDIVASGAEAIGILLTILMPEGFSEESLRKIIKDIESQCEVLNIEVMGGHTEVTLAVNQPIICVTGVGKVKKERVIQSSGAKPGQDIVISKWVGLEGTAIIARESQELEQRYTSSFIEEAKHFIQYISVIEESKIALKYGVTALHDGAEGGIYAALWELGVASNVGIEVELDQIPVKQETIEICEFFDLNPYKLNAGGCLIMCTEDGWGLVKALEKEGIKATVIGKITKGKERVVYSEEERKYLEPDKSDEQNKFFRRYL